MKSIPRQLNLLYSTRKKPARTTEIQFTCETCGKTYLAFRSNARCKHHYCSQPCAGLAKRKEFGYLHGKAGSYAIIHTPTGRRYIGASRNLHKRYEDHFHGLKAGIHRNKPLQLAYNQDGLASLEFRVLEYVEDITQLATIEQYWIDQTPAHLRFNISDFVTSKGIKASPEFCNQISERQKGRRPLNAILTAEQVHEIKTRLTQGERGIDLAKEFAVKQGTISAIKHGRNWDSIT